MARISPVPRLQFFDDNGDPLVGGKLYTYAAGTVTPLATYTDAGGGTEHTNPIILDSRGEVSLWLGSSLYDFVIHNADDELIYTADDISSQATVADLTAANITFSVTNGPSGTVQNALDGLIFERTATEIAAGVTPTNYYYPPGNVYRYGAVGNGVADDSTAIQNAVLSTPAGDTLIFPNGTFKLTTGITRSTPIKIVGSGIYGLGGTVINYTGSGVAMTFQTSQNGLRLQDFRLTGTSSATDGIAIQDCFNGIMLDHIAVEGFTNSGSGLGNCLKLDDTWDITAVACQFRQSRNGVVGEIGATFAVVNSVKLYGCELTDLTNVGIQIKSGVGWVIDGCDFSGLTTDSIGIDIAPSLTAGTNRQCKKHVIRGNYIEGASGATNVTGIRIGHLATIGSTSIASNKIEDNYIDVTGDNVYVDYAQDTTIRDNHHGAITAGKYKANLTANASRTVLDIRPRSNINDLGTNSFYETNDVQTLTEVSGNYTSPNKSAFQARPSANINNVTGNGAVYTIIFDSEIFDIQGEYNPATGVFTAQKTGKYGFSVGVTFNGAAGMTYCQLRLVTSNRTYDLFFGNAVASGTMTVSGSAIADMDAGDTAYITLEVGGLGGNTADIVQNYTYFSGALMG